MVKINRQKLEQAIEKVLVNREWIKSLGSYDYKLNQCAIKLFKEQRPEDEDTEVIRQALLMLDELGWLELE